MSYLSKSLATITTTVALISGIGIGRYVIPSVAETYIVAPTEQDLKEGKNIQTLSYAGRVECFIKDPKKRIESIVVMDNRDGALSKKENWTGLPRDTFVGLVPYRPKPLEKEAPVDPSAPVNNSTFDQYRTENDQRLGRIEGDVNSIKNNLPPQQQATPTAPTTPQQPQCPPSSPSQLPQNQYQPSAPTNPSPQPYVVPSNPPAENIPPPVPMPIQPPVNPAPMQGPSLPNPSSRDTNWRPSQEYPDYVQPNRTKIIIPAGRMVRVGYYNNQ